MWSEARRTTMFLWILRGFRFTLAPANRPGHHGNGGGVPVGVEGGGMRRRLAERYELWEKLGHGGMGEVWRATDKRLDRAVAVKLIKGDPGEEFRRRFDREAKILADVEHPNVVTVHDFGEDSGEMFLVMELLSGLCLSDRIHRGGLDVEEVIEIGIGICRALEAMQDRRVVHRDLKPGNVWVTEGGDVKVLDFGLAAFDKSQGRTPPASDSTLTKAGMVMGTPSYMSPEQIRGEDIDHRSDLYALGCLLFHCVTGATPYGSNGLAIAGHLAGRVPPSGGPLEGLIGSLMKAGRDERPRTASLVLAALERLRDGSPVGVLDTLLEQSSQLPHDAAVTLLTKRLPKLTKALGERNADIVQARLALARTAVRAGDPVQAGSLYRSLSKQRGLDSVLDAGDLQEIAALSRLPVPPLPRGDTAQTLGADLTSQATAFTERFGALDPGTLFLRGEALWCQGAAAVESGDRAAMDRTRAGHTALLRDQAETGGEGPAFLRTLLRAHLVLLRAASPDDRPPATDCGEVAELAAGAFGSDDREVAEFLSLATVPETAAGPAATVAELEQRLSLVGGLTAQRRFDEVTVVCTTLVDDAEKLLGRRHELTLTIAHQQAASLQDETEAITLLETWLPDFRAAGRPHLLALALGSLGQWLAARTPARARKLLTEALEHSQPGKLRSVTAYALAGLLEQDDPRSALLLYDEVLQGAAGESGIAAYAYGAACSSALLSLDPQDAVRHAYTARAYADDLGETWGKRGWQARMLHARLAQQIDQDEGDALIRQQLDDMPRYSPEPSHDDRATLWMLLTNSLFQERGGI